MDQTTIFRWGAPQALPPAREQSMMAIPLVRSAMNRYKNSRI